MENVIVSEEKHKPVLDEQTLAKLLEAAYVLQEHNREVRDLELGLDLRRDQLEAERKLKPNSWMPRSHPRQRPLLRTATTPLLWRKSSPPSTRFRFAISNSKRRWRWSLNV